MTQSNSASQGIYGASRPATPEAAEVTLYRRAGAAAGLGLGVQISLTVVAFVLLRVGLAEPLGSLAAFAAAGLVPWLAVAVLVTLRRAAATEALELEAARRSGESERTIFESELDARPARRRADRFARWGLPIFAVLTGLVLLAMGLLRMRTNWRGDASHVTADPLLVAGIAVGFAFVGFVAGRYLLGMGTTASVRGWGVLRGGATYLIGTVYLLALVAAGGAARALGVDGVNLVLLYAFPAVLAVVGAEMLLNVVLDFYRPRSAAGDARPAFDSRLLSLVSDPGGVVRSLNEAVNYQFGFEITNSWFWRLLSKSFAWLVVFGASVLLLLSCVIVVEPHQMALVTRFGRLNEAPRGPGLHLKAPWPFGRAEHFDVTRIRQMTVGSHERLTESAVLWTNQHADDETLLLVAPMSAARWGMEEADVNASPAGSDTPEVALAAAEVFVTWKIDPAHVVTYARNTIEPERLLRQIADTSLARQMLRHDIDSAIGGAREQIARDVEADLRASVDPARTGIHVLWVGIAGVHPAQQVADAFNATVAAEQTKQRSVQLGFRDETRILAASAGSVARARGIEQAILDLDRALASDGDRAGDVEALRLEVERLVQQAGGNASRGLFAARADRWELENQARSQSARYPADVAALEAAPEYYRVRLRLQVLEQNLPEREKIVVVGDPELRKLIRYDLRRVVDVIGGLGLSREGPPQEE